MPLLSVLRRCGDLWVSLQSFISSIYLSLLALIDQNSNQLSSPGNVGSFLIIDLLFWQGRLLHQPAYTVSLAACNYLDLSP